MQVVSLSSLIEATQDESEIYRYLSSFRTKRNKDVETFLHSNAIPNEKRALTRTSLVVDDENDDENEVAKRPEMLYYIVWLFFVTFPLPR